MTTRERPLGRKGTVLLTNLCEKVTTYFEANGSRKAYKVGDGVRAIIQLEALRAVKTGLRPEDVVPRILDSLIRKGFATLRAVESRESRSEALQRLNKLLEDALVVDSAQAYLTTLVRTIVFDALNEARFAAFEESAADGFVVAYQYSAILDDRTTEICKSLNGSIYARGNKIWGKYRPPIHYNCRSLLIPIFATDGWDGIESPPPTLEPEDGFN